MKYPDADTMLSLVALDNADGGYFTPGGRVYATYKGQLHEVLPSHLDYFQDNRWVEMLPPLPEDDAKTARVRVTDHGRYWLKRWAHKNRRAILSGGLRAVGILA